MRDPVCDQWFEEAFQLHQAGHFRDAEPIYRRVLERDHENSRALHLLGVLAFQLGQLESAEELIRRAIDIDPAGPQYHGHLGLVLAAAHQTSAAVEAYLKALSIRPDMPEVQNNLANALAQAGRRDEAIGAYRAALTLNPDFPEAHNNLGLLHLAAKDFAPAAECFHRAVTLRADYAEGWNNWGSALLGTGSASQALQAFERALALRRDYPDALNNQGHALKLLGRTDEAAAAFERALTLQSDLPEALNNLGLVLHAQGRATEAAALYRKALSAREDYADAHYNLSIAFRSLGDLKSATLECRRAVELNPHSFESLNNLGILLLEQAELPAAIDAFQMALAVNPHYPEAHNNLANALRQSGDLKDAVRHYRQAVTLRPDYAEAHNNLGSALQQSDRPGEAMASYQRALELQPDLAQAHNNLGNLFKDQAELDEAIASYQRACELNPDDPAADSNRVYTLYFHPGYTPAAILREHQRWHGRHAAALLRTVKPHDNDPVPRRRLKIGYVSPDFRDHCQSMFTHPLLSEHDHRAFEIHCYSDVARPDAITARIQTLADVWHNTVGLTDQQLADQIRRDKIDILVDLTLHMSRNRMPVFARKPAPVQVTWLGYPGTTGLATMDYRLSDPHLDPPGPKGEPGSHDRHYVEQTVRLPESFWCYDPLATAPALAVNELPALTNKFITFGCLNNFCKVNARTLGLWAQVMNAVPNSRLLVLAPRGSAREHLLETLQESAIAPTRVQFADRQPRDKYLALYNRIDIVLDTFPYNGHTTTLDALWMGVPVTTIIGRTAVSRGAYSQLANLGLKELAARSDKQFVRLTTDLATDHRRLTELRSTLRGRLTESPLMNAPRFADNVESAYRQMWQEWLSSRTRNLARPA
jgi:predicted O-linked N-acetylglucosamine transferase (SPINDLY family)